MVWYVTMRHSAVLQYQAQSGATTIAESGRYGAMCFWPERDPATPCHPACLKVASWKPAAQGSRLRLGCRLQTKDPDLSVGCMGI